MVTSLQEGSSPLEESCDSYRTPQGSPVKTNAYRHYISHSPYASERRERIMHFRERSRSLNSTPLSRSVSRGLGGSRSRSLQSKCQGTWEELLFVGGSVGSSKATKEKLDCGEFSAYSNFCKLLSKGKEVTNQLQSLLANPSADLLEGDQIEHVLGSDAVCSTQAQLLHRLQGLFVKQQKINEANMQLNQINYVINMSNVVRHREIANLAEKGKKAIEWLNQHASHQQRKIKSLKNTVQTLQENAASQSARTSRVEKALKEGRELLEACILQYKADSEHQRALFAQQEANIQTLMKGKLKWDLLLNVAVLSSAFFCVNSFFVDFPIGLICKLLCFPLRANSMKRTRAIYSSKLFIKGILGLVLVRQMKLQLFRVGLLQENYCGIEKGWGKAKIVEMMARWLEEKNVLVSSLGAQFARKLKTGVRAIVNEPSIDKVA
eukprot:Nk52_evm27s1810 gene=Nk52_evmTU27s1810